MLRARAVAPANPRLQEEVGGDQDFTEHLCRWLSASIALRSIRMLVEVSR